MKIVKEKIENEKICIEKLLKGRKTEKKY